MLDQSIPSTPKGNPNNRERIAKIVAMFVLISTGAIAIIGIIMIWTDTKDDKKFDHFKDILSTLLPLWGTWIGTVLAYYFSKDNFQAANASVQQIVDKLTSEKKLEKVKAIDVMIPKDKLIKIELTPGQNPLSLTLHECIKYVEDNKIKRVILLDSNGVAKYAIHRDLISYFITSKIMGGATDVSNLTLQDMHDGNVGDIQNTIDNSVRFISENANLLEAKNIMQQNKTCQDVFITKNGKADEPVLGWITNVTITENSIV